MTLNVRHFGEPESQRAESPLRGENWSAKVRRCGSRCANLSWFVSAVIAVGMMGWAFLDPSFERSAVAIGMPDTMQWPNSALRHTESSLHRDPRQLALILCLIAGLSSAGIVFASLFVGSRSQRSLRRWGYFVVLGAAWCHVLTGWSGLSWSGKEWRMSDDIAMLWPTVERLRTHWPTIDGDDAWLGSYMAYPIAQPSVLLLLTPPRLSTGEIAVSSVERGENGAIRFELGGRERGDWLEWHPAGSKPGSFTGGLLDHHELVKSTPLKSGWFLARYESGPRI